MIDIKHGCLLGVLVGLVLGILVHVGRPVFRRRRRWILTRTIWPYPEGYGTAFFVGSKMTYVDAGLDREQAATVVELENATERITARLLWKWRYPGKTGSEPHAE